MATTSAAWFKDSADAEPEPAPRVVFVPRDEVEIHDTWDVIGMLGTGSHDVSLTDLEIDRARTCAFHEPTWPDEPLWRMPPFTVLLPGLTAVCLGVARGCRHADSIIS